MILVVQEYEKTTYFYFVLLTVGQLMSHVLVYIVIE
jgi:hypothetical protein